MAEFHPKPFGKYFLIEKLATGGMAEIYKAKTFGVDGFEKILAIKRILPHCAVDKEFISMLVDEAKLSVLLSHTNIVQVYDLGKVGDDYFISMEFINGINLREVLNRAKEISEKFSEEIVVYILSETCKGLDYAHSKKDNESKPLNIVHRDISPQNILLSFEGEVKIVDFGIAKAAMNISHTMAGILKGKISYMSPEQALGKPIDRKTDIFSTGLILYELLTGEKLFTGETQFEVLKKIRTTRLNENSFPDSIPIGLRKILAKALAYSVKERYDNAGDMQIDLTRYLYSTYIDFTPRKLSSLMRKLFAQEIQIKTGEVKPDDVAIDSKTRSVMIDAVAQQNLVHRDNDEVTGGFVEKQPTQTFIESFISGQDEGSGSGNGVPEITRTGLEQVMVPPKPAPKAAPPAKAKPAVAAKPATPAAAKAPGKSKKWLVYPFAALLLLAAGTTAYFKTDWFKSKPPPVQITGVLQINSTPAGAQVFLNEKDSGQVTPATLKDLKVGEAQKITLKKSKFKDWTQTLSLADQNPVTLNPTLDVIPVGTIKVVTTPPGAKIFIDGKDSGKVSPFSFEELPLSQTVSLRIELDKHRPVEERVTVYSIEPMEINKKLEEILMGPIKVSSTPPGARIFLNSNDTGLSTPATLPDQEVGKRYTVRLARQGYQDLVRSVDLSDKQGASVTERLVKVDEKTPEQIAQEKARQEAEKQKALEAQRLKEQQQAQQQQQNQTTDPKEAARLKAEAEKQKQAQAQREKERVEREAREKAEREKQQQQQQTTQPEAGAETFVALSSNPKGADVFINGVRKGSSPGRWKVSSGTPLEITISKSGLSTVTRVVTLRPGETRNLGTISLGGGSTDTEKPSGEGAGIVMVDSNPPGAMVLLNGQPQKSTPLRIKGLRPATTHTITVKKDGYQTWSTSFTVTDGTKSFMANLKKL